jgi:hypothetical protein
VEGGLEAMMDGRLKAITQQLMVINVPNMDKYGIIHY